MLKPFRAEGAKTLARHLAEEIASGRLMAGARLPPERELGERFGISRGAVRRVLADFREQGVIVQTVGSGTFVAETAHTGAQAGSMNPPAGPRISISPAELMEARLLIEPLLPSLIAQHATAVDFASMQHCIEQSEAASTIEAFEYWDGELHKAFALATKNAFFMEVLKLTNQVREQGEWGRLKRNSLTPERRMLYERQHRDIVGAMRDRDAVRAAALLTEHLRQVRGNLFGE